MWNVALQCDIIRGSWYEPLNCYVFLEKWYIVAWKGDDCYLHFYQFWGNYSLAKKTYDAIMATEGFSPRYKAKVWFPIRDRKPFVAAEIKSRRPKKWWIEKTPYKR